MTVAGRPRVVVVHVPDGYAGSTKVPLVLNLHGSASTGAGQEAFSGMDATADADGFIVAYPQALIPEGEGFAWNVPGASLADGIAVPKDAPDDVSFLTALVAALEQRYCVDPDRVYATGFSGGARLVSALACDASGVFAAVAPVSGIRRLLPCSTKRAVPIIAFHGTADRVDPYGGNGQPYWTYSVPQAAADWAGQDNCSPTAMTTTGTGYDLIAYSGCARGSSVELYTILGEGHEWPGGPRLPEYRIAALGPQSNAVDADSTMWRFFAAHPMP
ncbi:MAG: extracellular catalytic domain type 1 short-chain-length polyhydroxyalkanoate depolymerase [Acidimicrobiales bacterium]